MDLPTSAALLDFITQLAQKRPFRHQEIAAATGHTLRRDSASINPYFAMYHSSAAGKGSTIAAVELREPQGQDPGQDGLLIVQLGDKPCVTQREVTERFGKSPALSVPTPHQPPTAPLYLVYPQDWGKLRFGFARQGSECLVTVVLDATRGG